MLILHALEDVWGLLLLFPDFLPALVTEVLVAVLAIIVEDGFEPRLF